MAGHKSVDAKGAKNGKKGRQEAQGRLHFFLALITHNRFSHSLFPIPYSPFPISHSLSPIPHFPLQHRHRPFSRAAMPLSKAPARLRHCFATCGIAKQ